MRLDSKTPGGIDSIETTMTSFDDTIVICSHDLSIVYIKTMI